MDDLLRVAVAGTARVGDPSESPVSPVERAIATIDPGSTERRLLLAAGVHAVRRRAGVLPLTQADAPGIAEDETWPVAPERVALLIGELLSGNADLLPEALARLQAVKLLIPPALLPVALDVGKSNTAVRAALLVVIGERGRWLAHQNPDWSWATAPGTDEIAANAEAIWQEGKDQERLEVLRLVRSSDPGRGRALLESTWRREPAAFRAEAIDVLGMHLSADDQPFLDRALEDRSATVRERAEMLLLRIPGSRPARDAAQRAEQMIGKRLGVQIVIRPPDDVEPAKAIIQAFSRVPPSHWVTHLGKQPSDLARAIAKDGDWGFSVLDGLTRAALTFADEQWAEALWLVWLTSSPALGKAQDANDVSLSPTALTRMWELLRVMRARDAENAVANALSARLESLRLSVALPYLARPWSAEFTDHYLPTFHDLSKLSFQQAEIRWPVVNNWTASFQAAALAIPYDRIGSAIVMLNDLLDAYSNDKSDHHWEYWKNMLRRHVDTLRMRQRIHEEIRA